MSNNQELGWRHLFPLAAPRPEQAQAIDFIIDAFLNKKKEYVIAEMGTGVGKSAIAVTVARWFSYWHTELLARGIATEPAESSKAAAYVLTSQKILQDQYVRDFRALVTDIRSSNNYKCGPNMGRSCAETMRIERFMPEMNSCKGRGTCAYRSQKELFKAACVGITNYSYILSETVYAHGLKPRELLVLDECVRGDTKVWVSEGVELPIEFIYENDDITHVMSFNQHTNSYEKQRIVRKIRTPWKKDQNWYEIVCKLPTGKQTKLVVTDNHKIWTSNRGYVRADELTTSDVVKFDTSIKYNVRQKMCASEQLRSKRANDVTQIVSCVSCQQTFQVQQFQKHLNSIVCVKACETCKQNFEIQHYFKEQNKRFCSFKCFNESSRVRRERAQRMVDNNPMINHEIRKKMRDSWKKNWQNKPEYEKNQILNRFVNAPKHNNRSEPNNLEKFVVDLQIPEIEFTGLGTKWVTFKNGKKKNPDFVVKDTNKVIEVGDVYFWHSEEEIANTVSEYEKIGYQCLYLTNKQIDEDPQQCAEIIRKFVYNHDLKITSIRKLRKSNRLLPGKEYFKYNLEIEHTHNFFANSLLVSNCHNIEDEMRKWSTITISKRFVDHLGLNWPSEKEFETWLTKKYRFACAKTLSKLEKEIKDISSGNASGDLEKLSKHYEALDKHLCQAMRYIVPKGGAKRSDFLKVFDDEKIEIKPLEIGPDARLLLYPLGNHKLLMSATILDFDVFMRNAGLRKEEVATLSIPSPFPPENRPIMYVGAGSMSKKNIQATLPSLAKIVKEILKMHPKEKGIIHAHTYQIAKYIKEHVSSDRLLLHDSTNRDKTLQLHKLSARPTVLLSPSMSEGVDLKDDLSRFQVICKIPYPYMGDPVIAEKLKKDPKWYSWITARTIVQSAGRSIRNKDDKAVTYVLDSDWQNFLRRNSKMFPAEFKSSFQ